MSTFSIDISLILGRYCVSPRRSSPKGAVESVSALLARVVSRCSPWLERRPRFSLCPSPIPAGAAAVMSLSSVAKRKHPPPPARADPSPKRTRTSASSSFPRDDLALLDLESQVHHLGAKVFAFRQKGLSFFARLSQERVQPNPERTIDTAPTQSKNAHEDLRQVLKERLAVANLMLPTLLEELVMWKTKIQQAVDVKRKDQRLPFLDNDENGI